MLYNTQRKRLIIPEYGRHIQQLVDEAIVIEDQQQRTQFAKSIINIMGTLNPHLRDVPDFQHKLWDQLFIMSEFKLEVDSPYPIPKKEDFEKPPHTIIYPKNERELRYYGSHVRRMMEVAKTWEEGDRKQGLVYAIANQMKKNYINWNKDQVEDAVILNHLKIMSEGELQLDEKEVLVKVQPTVAPQNPQRRHGKQNKNNFRKKHNNLKSKNY